MLGAPFKPFFGLSGIPPRWTGGFLLQRIRHKPPQEIGAMGHPSSVTGRERQVCEKSRLGEPTFAHWLLRRNIRVVWFALQPAEFFHFSIGVRGLPLFAINAGQAKMRLCGKRSIFLQA
jgi:hypothetical protein